MGVLHKKILDLSLNDLRSWAGSKILNRGKSYKENVYELTRTEQGGLLASVSGTEEYETWVGVDEDGFLDYFCTCPYDWGACKHAVAVILAGLAMVKAGEKIPVAADGDDLSLRFDGDFDEDDGDDVAAAAAVQSILRKKKKGELLEMLLYYARRYPDVGRDILETDQLQSGDIETLLCSLAAEIEEVTGEDAWCNWPGDGNLPDYSHIQQQLAALLSKGHADEVIALGRQLWERGREQVGQSHDDGETAEEIINCMEIIFKAVADSSMSAADQLLWFIGIFIEDPYSLSDGGMEYIRSRRYRKEHWKEVASALQSRLETTPKPKQDNAVRYHREEVMNWLITAFKKSGQSELVLPLLEKEAHVVLCYDRIVDLLQEDGRIDRARKWCVKGYERTRDEYAGIAASLQKKLQKIALQEKQPDLVATYRAQDFFASPDLQNYLDLEESCKEVGCWSAVHRAVMCFLETGQQPDLVGKDKQWPLPVPEVEEKKDRGSHLRLKYPLNGLLIKIALHEERLEDVVTLYSQQQSSDGWQNNLQQEVAEAVAISHPEIALTIWHELALKQIAQVQPAAYEVAATYLGKMHRVLQQAGQLDRWQNLISTIRSEHRRKRRLLEVLDSLEWKRIID
jgi:uncharacterized Zn finger protein